MSKGSQTRVRNLQNQVTLTVFVRRLETNVKRVPNGPFQGLDLGEIVFRDFPFRLWKSCK